MDLQGYSNRDKSIIKANPNANPYELKELGLSEKGFNRLLEGEGGSDYDESESHIEDDAPVLESQNEDLEVNETAEIPAQSENSETINIPGSKIESELANDNHWANAKNVDISKNTANDNFFTTAGVVYADGSFKNLKNEDLPANIVKMEVKKIQPTPSVSIRNVSNNPIVTDLNVNACKVENLKNGRKFRMSVSAAKTLNPKDFKIIEYVN